MNPFAQGLTPSRSQLAMQHAVSVGARQQNTVEGCQQVGPGGPSFVCEWVPIPIAPWLKYICRPVQPTECITAEDTVEPQTGCGPGYHVCGSPSAPGEQPPCCPNQPTGTPTKDFVDAPLIPPYAPAPRRPVAQPRPVPRPTPSGFTPPVTMPIRTQPTLNPTRAQLAAENRRGPAPAGRRQNGCITTEEGDTCCRDEKGYWVCSTCVSAGDAIPGQPGWYCAEGPFHPVWSANTCCVTWRPGITPDPPKETKPLAAPPRPGAQPRPSAAPRPTSIPRPATRAAATRLANRAFRYL